MIALGADSLAVQEVRGVGYEVPGKKRLWRWITSWRKQPRLLSTCMTLETAGSPCKVGGGGSIYEWRELNATQGTNCDYRTSGLNVISPQKKITLLWSGAWSHLVTRIGNGTKQAPTIAPMTGNSWPVCWCYLLNPIR